jgi:hypothetical protein
LPSREEAPEVKVTATPLEALEIRTVHHAAVMGVPWTGQPYGALLCEHDDGHKVTLITDDIEFHRVLLALDGHQGDQELEVPEGIYTVHREGWPSDPDWEWPER